MKTLLLAAGLLLALSMVGVAQSDTDGARRAVETYISIKEPASKHDVVYRDARIISIDGQGRVVESLISKPAKDRKGVTVVLPEQRITSIDMTDGAALVKVESVFPADSTQVTSPRTHIQYISLLKLNGDWKIVSILMPPLRLEQVARN